MISRVVEKGVHFSHQIYVRAETERLVRCGYVVGKKSRIRKKMWGVFGVDVTDIEYDFPRKAKL